MLLAVLSGFILAAFAPWLSRSIGDKAGWILALLPASLFVYFIGWIPVVSAQGAVVVHYDWVPALDINLSFLIDGLSLLFALLISGIGTFIVIYSGGYLHGHPLLPRFYAILLSFMAAMLGVVLSNNLIGLFVFWELTSVTSYLLIGFYHEDKKSRWNALQGLLVTVGGGLALLVGLILLGNAGGSFELSELLGQGDVLREYPLYTGMLVLILLGCFTKSAQVPFHFWLPNAMAAPTPVSAFLHSATMVKAGVYLMARLNPGLGGTELWLYSLGIFGALTMFTGSFMALRSTNAKQVLAYTTIMALGTLTMLIGIGTEAAIIAAMVFLLAHALYKAALFMLAGVLDHETGTKDITQMGGLRKSMPVAFVTACIAALSLAGLPPLFGFVAKELMFKATLAAPMLTWFTTVLAWLSAVMIVAMAMVFALRPFTGRLQSTPKTPHEAPPALLIGPIVLAGLSLVFGMLGTVPATMLIDSAVLAVYGEQLTIDLALWHGINTPLLLSVAAVGVGALLFWQWPQILSVYQRLTFIDRFGPERGYEQLLTGLHGFAKWQTGVLQNGYMRNYLITILLTTVALIGWTYFGYTGNSWPAFSVDIRFYEAVVAALIVAGAIAASVTHSRLGAVATVGMVGFGVAIMYLFFSAPDVGMTQIMVETLTVILLVLVLFKLPSFLALSSPAARVRDAIVAIAFGGMMTLLLLAVNDVTVVDKISDQLVAWSYTQAYGRNIVNVILVDFRALDTLGEIFVVGMAAVGVYAMIRLRAEDNIEDNKE